MRRVRQNQCAEIACAGGAEHAAAEALGDMAGDVPAVIQVRVREDDGVDRGRRDGERLPIAQAQLFEALKESAVDQDLVVTRVDEVFGPGDGACRTQKC